VSCIADRVFWVIPSGEVPTCVVIPADDAVDDGTEKTLETMAAIKIVLRQ
jgi:hypothetical protein